MGQSNDSVFNRRWSVRYGGYILVIFGITAASIMYPTLERALAEHQWKETECTIDSAKIITDEYAVSSLEFAYRYTVEGIERVGSDYETRSNISRDKSFYQKALKNLKTGSKVPCYYDPAHPDKAVIQRTSYGEAAAIVVPALFILLGALKLIIQYRARFH